MERTLAAAPVSCRHRVGMVAAMTSAQFTWFRRISLAEGTSFLVLLLIAMPLKYAANLPVAVMIAGSVHGLLFIAYCLFALDARTKLEWTNKRAALVFVGGVLPAGAFFVERSLRVEEAALAVA